MFNKKPRMRSSVRTILSVAGMTLAVAAVPASASAAVRTGSVQDPQGDASALSGPVLDLKSVAVRYDDAAGTLRVTWTYYNDVRTELGGLGAKGGVFQADRPIALNVAVHRVTAAGRWQLWDRLGVDSALSTCRWPSCRAPATVSPDGRVVTAEFSHTMLAGHDLQYSWGDSRARRSSRRRMTQVLVRRLQRPKPAVYPPRAEWVRLGLARRRPAMAEPLTPIRA